jgi:DNA polymerase III delta subunit
VVEAEKFFINGSDESLIDYVKVFLIKAFKDKNYHIDKTGYVNDFLSGDLFSEKKVLFVLDENFSNKEVLNLLDTTKHAVIIASKNNKKNTSFKTKFINSKKMLCVDCYPMNRKSKEVILKNFIQKNNLIIKSDVFWYIVESFDNSYVFFISQLENLIFLGQNIDSVKKIEKSFFVETKVEINKFFFHILNKNTSLLSLFSKNIYSQSDLYLFLNTIKIYLDIIASSSNTDEALSKLPRYLFNEKDIFAKIYRQLNKNKLLIIYKNISKVELLIRKKPNLYYAIGQRFLLNTKKIIIS